jgi:hypothetical protein
MDLGVWPIFSAGLPNMIRCPRCKARLGYRRLGTALLVLLPASGAVLAAAYFVTLSFEGVQRLVAFTVVLFGAWVPVELVAAKYLRHNRMLEYRSGGTPPAEEGDAGPGAQQTRHATDGSPKPRWPMAEPADYWNALFEVDNLPSRVAILRALVRSRPTRTPRRCNCCSRCCRPWTRSWPTCRRRWASRTDRPCQVGPKHPDGDEKG